MAHVYWLIFKLLLQHWSTLQTFIATLVHTSNVYWNTQLVYQLLSEHSTLVCNYIVTPNPRLQLYRNTRHSSAIITQHSTLVYVFYRNTALLNTALLDFATLVFNFYWNTRHSSRDIRTLDTWLWNTRLRFSDNTRLRVLTTLGLGFWNPWLLVRGTHVPTTLVSGFLELTISRQFALQHSADQCSDVKGWEVKGWVLGCQESSGPVV